MSDSDETVGPDSDETLPPEDYERSESPRSVSPDLFDNHTEKRHKGMSRAKVDELKTSVKRHNSQYHDISDSGSDSDMCDRQPRVECKGENRSSSIKGSSSYKANSMDEDSFIKSTNGQTSFMGKDSCIKSTNGKTNCKDSFEKSENGRTPQNVRTKRETSSETKSDKKKFIDEFLDMTDSESDDEYEQNKRKILAMKERVLQDKSKLTKQSTNQKTKSDFSGQKKTEHTNHFLQKEHKKDYSKPFHTGGSSQDKLSNIVSPNERRRSQESKSATPTSSLKRKHSRSPVPQELRKAVTDILSQNSNTSAQRKKAPCQYGLKCYRKNPSHFEDFSHPGDEDSVPVKKKAKVDISPSTSKEKHRTHSPLSTKVRSESPSESKFKTGSKVRPVSPSTSKVRSEVPSTSRVKTHSPTPDCKVIKRSGSLCGHPRTIEEKLKLAEPYSFFLTKVTGISDTHNATYVMDIKDLLSEGMGNLTASCQLNFMFDIPWLMKQYPAQFRSKPLLIVHGEHGSSMANLQAQAMPYSNIRFCQAKLEMMYGTHHTKMMLLLYEDGLRVVIHTSNLIQQDWFQKTQGMWISPVFPRLPEASKDKGDSPTHFKRDLLEYLQAYKAYQLKDWIDHIAKHDMSTARVVIIGSVPGRHIGDKARSMWGHLKVRKVLQEHGPSQGTVKAWPVIGQFSSIGSMGPSKENWLCGEWQQSLSAARSASGPQSSTRLQLIFPSRHNVRLCLEGYPAGGSIPYTTKTAKKQPFLHDFFHVWKSEGRGRSRAMPHIKSYARPMQDGSKAAWFIVTSANLSKAAWGALEKKGTQLMIRSYEIGVMFLPKFFGEGEIFPITSDPKSAATTNKLLLPYDLPPTIYDKKDRPWMWDIPYMDLPDTNGNVWCPFSK